MKRTYSFLVILLPFVLFFAFCGNNTKTKKKFNIMMETSGEKVNITIVSVFDNYRVDRKLETSWGLACVIETPSENILFDTGGDAAILLSNMQKMNIDPGSIEKILISHIHGDHAGGLEGFLEKTVMLRSLFLSLSQIKIRLG